MAALSGMQLFVLACCSILLEVASASSPILLSKSDYELLQNIQIKKACFNDECCQLLSAYVQCFTHYSSWIYWFTVGNKSKF